MSERPRSRLRRTAAVIDRWDGAPRRYPEFVKIRERWESRLGKPIAAAVAIVTVLRRCPPLEAEVDGVPCRPER